LVVDSLFVYPITMKKMKRKKKRRNHCGGHHRLSTMTISSSTLDLDAAPLNLATIVSHVMNYAKEGVKHAERRECEPVRKAKEK
jgi:hypothetical protein